MTKDEILAIKDDTQRQAAIAKILIYFHKLGGKSMVVENF